MSTPTVPSSSGAPLRRPYLPQAGESLLLIRPEPDTPEAAGTPGLIRLATRVEEFATDSGLSDADIHANPLLSAPIPIYATRIPQGRRRWHGLNPQMMWHPLLWLPERLAEPYLLTSAEEEDRLESTDEWALRVAMELTASGLYDPATGGWVDVLALHEIDITDPGVQDRLAAWLEGATDADLDAVDLSPYLELPGDSSWAVAAVQGLLADLFGASWSLVASDLMAMTLGVQSAEPVNSDRLGQILTMAGTYLGEAVLDLNITVADRVQDLADPGLPATERADGLLDMLELVWTAYSPSLLELEELSAPPTT